MFAHHSGKVDAIHPVLGVAMDSLVAVWRDTGQQIHDIYWNIENVLINPVVILVGGLMNIHHCYSLRNLIPAAILTIGFTSSALAQVSSALFVDLDSKKVTYLGTLAGNYNYPSGINDMGQVVGYSFTETGQSHAFVTGPNGVGVTDLGTLGGGLSEAYGINNAGQVAGTSMTDKGQYHAFITGPDGLGMRDLGTLGGGGSGASGSTTRGRWWDTPRLAAGKSTPSSRGLMASA